MSILNTIARHGRTASLGDKTNFAAGIESHILNKLDKRKGIITGKLGSLESALVDPQNSSFTTTATDVTEGIRGAVKDEFYMDRDITVEEGNPVLNGKDGDEISAIQGELDQSMAANSVAIEAATIAALGIHDQRGYYDAIKRGVAQTGDRVVSEGGGLRHSVESFDKGKFDEFKSATIEFNYRTAKQTEIGQVFFPMVVCTPDKALFKAEISLATLGKNKHHSDSELYDQELVTLQESYRNGKVFDDETLSLVPYVTEKNKDSDWFADSTYVQDEEVEVEGEKFKTRSLRPGTEVNLIGVSQHPGRIKNGAANQNTQIANRMAINYIDVLITKSGSDPERRRVKLLNTPGSEFGYHQGAGNTREMILALYNSRIGFGDISKSTILKPFSDAGESLYWKLELTGRVDINRGKLSVNGTAGVSTALDANGQEVAPDLDGIKFEVIGYKVDAKASNSDLAIMGDLVGCTSFYEHYRVGLRQPVAAHQAMADNGQQPQADMSPAEKLKMITEFVRSQMDYDAHQTLESYLNSMTTVHDRRLKDGSFVGDIFECEAVRGVAAKIMKPIKIETKLDLSKAVDTVSSKNRMEDIKGAVVSKLVSVITKLDQDSGFSLACRSYGYGDENFKPIAKVLTSRRLASLMMITGDTRTLGPEFNMEIAKTDRNEWVDKVLIQLSAPQRRRGEYEALVSGACLYVPEFVGQFNLKRGAGTITEMAVQPQYLHVVNVPAFALIEVTGIEEAFGEKDVDLVDQIEVANP